MTLTETTRARKDWLPSDYIKHGWCKGVPAMDRLGNMVHPLEPRAEKWSLRSVVEYMLEDNVEYLAQLIDELGVPGDFFALAAWSMEEGRTKAEIVDVLRKVEITLGLRED